MSTNQAKNELLVSVLFDLAGICKKLAANPVVPEKFRAEASGFVEEFNALLPAHGKATPAQHAQGEMLLAKMARLLPSVIDSV